MKTNRLLLSALLAISAFSLQLSALADVPNLINYQGRLRDNLGLPLNGTVNIQVNLFTNETAGAAVFAQHLGPVPVTNGVYSFAFGGSDLPAVLSHPEVWLGVAVDGNVLTPRQRLLAVPYAIVAGSLAPDTRLLIDSTNHIAARLAGTHPGGFGYGATIELQNHDTTLGNVTGVMGLNASGSAVAGIEFENIDHGGWGQRMGALSLFTMRGAGMSRLYMATNGNVGIGLLNPQGKLDIVSTHNASDRLIVFGPTDNAIAIQTLLDNRVLAAYDSYGGDENRLLLQPMVGNVGIGVTNPAAKLDVAGTIKCVSLQQTSDARLKKEVQTIVAPLEKVRQLRGVEFSWNQEQRLNTGFDDRPHLGLIAQEVEAVLPQTVSTAQDGTKSLDYQALIPVLIEAIKTQQQRIDNQQAEIDQLKQFVTSTPRQP